MSQILGLTVPLIAIGAIAMFANIKENESEKNFTLAKEILSKKASLKEYLSLSTIENKYGINESSIRVGGENIKKLIVPSKDYTEYDILLLSKYQQAVKNYLDTNDPAVTPTCEDLNQSISAAECDRATTIPFWLFEYNSGDIAFTTSLEIGNIIKKLEPNLKVIDSNATNISFFDDYPISKYSKIEGEKKQQRKVQIQKEIETLSKTNPSAASRLNKKMFSLDKAKAFSNSQDIIDKAQGDNLSSADLKEIAKNTTFIVEKQKVLSLQKTEVETDELYQEQALKIQAFSNTNLTDSEKSDTTISAQFNNLEDSSTLIKIRRGL